MLITHRGILTEIINISKSIFDFSTTSEADVTKPEIWAHLIP